MRWERKKGDDTPRLQYAPSRFEDLATTLVLGACFALCWLLVVGGVIGAAVVVGRFLSEWFG